MSIFVCLVLFQHFIYITVGIAFAMVFMTLDFHGVLLINNM